MPDVRRILVPLDHSSGWEAVVEYACVVARGVGGSIAFLHVYEPPDAMVGVVPGATIAGELAAERSAGDAVLDRAAALARANGIATTDRILEPATPPSRAIVDHACQGKFDLIVMGTHSLSRLSRLAVGSVAERVLHEAPCPILMVHLPRR